MNVSDFIISHNKNNYECQLIIKKNETVKDDSHFFKREQLASKWAHSYLQKCAIINSDDNEECETSQHLFMCNDNIDQKL